MGERGGVGVDRADSDDSTPNMGPRVRERGHESDPARRCGPLSPRLCRPQMPGARRSGPGSLSLRAVETSVAGRYRAETRSGAAG